MSVTYLKKAEMNAATGQDDVQTTVRTILNEIEAGGDSVAKIYAAKFDKWDGNIVVTPDEVEAAGRQVNQQLKDDIQFAHDNVRKFAEAQKATIGDCEVEIIPGLIAGQKQIPMGAAGCYVPGGRYSHIASAIMTVTTAKVAGVGHITAVSPPRPGIGINPAILYTLDLCGADTVLNLGGIQGIAAMAFGLFGTPSADILVGPGNQFVAEAKRLLYGRVGIDMFAGPTESMVIADHNADPMIVAWDLVGQAEHGYNSPVWLISLDQDLARKVLELVPQLTETLPQVNRDNALAAWRDYGEVTVADTRQEVVALSDEYASEHLQIQCDDLDFWKENLKNYGSLFLGEETTVAFGDKCSGPNHVLPTKGAGKYSGGLSVGKYMKTVTWQQMTRDANRQIAQTCARISRLEGMEGHARTGDVRLEKYFPGEKFDLNSPNDQS